MDNEDEMESYASAFSFLGIKMCEGTHIKHNGFFYFSYQFLNMSDKFIF